MARVIVNIDGKKLAQLRSSRRLTQRELANILGVTATRIGHIESTSQAGMYPANFRKLAVGLKMSEDELAERLGGRRFAYTIGDVVGATDESEDRRLLGLLRDAVHREGADRERILRQVIDALAARPKVTIDDKPPALLPEVTPLPHGSPAGKRARIPADSDRHDSRKEASRKGR
jgi:transcriptional regulator with XRE-family HTH domain